LDGGELAKWAGVDNVEMRSVDSEDGVEMNATAVSLRERERERGNVRAKDRELLRNRVRNRELL
jgi:hypothetical protein